jgi:Ca2+-binding RTX toxin-like protein
MARIKFGDQLGSYDVVSTSTYYSQSFDLETNERKHAVYRDTEENSSVVFDGRGILYDGDAMVAGTIEKITFMSPSDGVYLTVTGDFKAAQIYGQFGQPGGVDRVYHFVLKGSDTVIGSVKKDLLHGFEGKDSLNGGIGDDWLSGGVGNDRLTGGRGSDLFIFGAGEGRDVITDFDAVGGEGNQDFLFFGNIEGFEKHRDGGNTVFEFDGGGRLTILDVRPGQITTDDFDSP